MAKKKYTYGRMLAAVGLVALAYGYAGKEAAVDDGVDHGGSLVRKEG
jgi:hypothetical protein